MIKDYLKLPEVRYFFVGIFGAILEFFIFQKLINCKYSILISNLFSFHSSVIACYLLHFYVTHGASKRNGIISKFFRYITLMYVQFIFGSVILWGFINYIEFGVEVSKLMQIALVTPISYLIQKFFIFTRKT